MSATQAPTAGPTSLDSAKNVTHAQLHDHANHAQAPGSIVGTTAYQQYSTEMHAGMEKMMRDMHADSPSGDPDIDFLVMMIPHHMGAVEMSRLLLRDGRDSLVRDIAEKIIASQLAEIEAAHCPHNQ